MIDDRIDALFDPDRPAACDECKRRPVPSRLAPGHWIDTHSGTCSQNSALEVCERCGQRHADLDFGQMLTCVMGVSLEEGRAMQSRIADRVARAALDPEDAS